jgi:hypothetical protein
MTMDYMLQRGVAFVGRRVIAVAVGLEHRRISKKVWLSLAFVAVLILPSTGTKVTARLQPTTTQSRSVEWAWFQSVSTRTGWWIVHGKASVRISGHRFEADLRDSADPTYVRLSLRGSTSNGVATVRVSTASSDKEDFDLSGRLRRACWKKGGRETIIFTDGEDVIGLVRELDESSSCTPS